MQVGSNAAQAARRERIAAELQKTEQQEQLRRENLAKLAQEEAQRRQRVDKARQLYFAVAGSDNPDEVAAVAKELKGLGKEDESLGLYAQDLETKLPLLTQRRDAALAVKDAALKTAQKGDEIKLQAMQLGLEQQKNPQLNPQELLRYGDHNTAAAVMRQKSGGVPTMQDQSIIEAIQADKDEQLRSRTPDAVVPYAPGYQPRRQSSTREDAKPKPAGKWTYKVDGEGNTTRTWEGSEPPPAEEMPQAAPTYAPLQEDRKDYDKAKGKIKEMAQAFIKLDPKDPKVVEMQDEAKAEIERIHDMAKRAIALEPDPAKQDRIFLAALMEKRDLLAPFGAIIGKPKPGNQTQPAAPAAPSAPSAPVLERPQQLPVTPAAAAQPVEVAPGQMTDEQMEQYLAQKRAEKAAQYKEQRDREGQQARRELMQDLEIAGGTIKETAKTAAKVAGGVALAFLSESESSKKRRIQREAIRAQLEAKGIKPTEDQIDKILNAR